MKTVFTTILCVILISCGLGQALAQGNDPKQPDRVLGRHAFLPVDLVPDPFVNTRFSMSTGVGFGQMELSQDVPVGGDVTMPAGTYNLAVLGQILDLQLGLLDWLALRGKLGGFVLSGLDMNAALNFGASVNYEWEAGAIFRILRTKMFQLSISGDFSSDNTLGIKPAQFIGASFASGSISTDNLFSKENNYGFSTGTQIALALHDSLGLWLSAKYAHAFKDDGGTGTVITGSGLSFDLHPLIRVPLGLVGYYQLEQGLEDTDEPLHYFGAGVFISGRDNLALGIEGAVMMANYNDILKVNAYQAAFKMRYYW
jgi:hypothetical protein